MTDPTDRDPEPQGFAIVPTLHEWQEVQRRLLVLELGGAPQQLTAELVGGDDIAAVSARLDRHRAEIESIKGWCNDMAKALDLRLQPLMPAATSSTTTAPKESPL